MGRSAQVPQEEGDGAASQAGYVMRAPIPVTFVLKNCQVTGPASALQRIGECNGLSTLLPCILAAMKQQDRRRSVGSPGDRRDSSQPVRVRDLVSDPGSLP